MTPHAPPGPPHSPRSSGASASLILLFVLVGLGAVLVVGAGVAWLVWRGVDRAIDRGLAASIDSGSPAPTVALPPVTRRVPHHPLSVLDGCSESDVHALADGIDGAISVGAPLYNEGNFAGCYHLYDGTAADLERKLPATCPGPVRALEAGRTRAASLTGASAQAWAMRDAFDGLLDLVERSESAR